MATLDSAVPPGPEPAQPARALDGLRTLALPHILAFLASFSIMVVELVGGRIIAAHVGASLYTWTSVIGVILGGITVGNLAGGRMGDRYPPRQTLPFLFLAAAATCLLIPPLNGQIGRQAALTTLPSWPLRIFIHVALVFAMPAVALGLIGPVVAKLALDRGLQTGRTVGDVYASGALGSILGTLATGFYLIAAFGIRTVVWSVAGILAAVGIALLRGNITRLLLFWLVLLGLGSQSPWYWGEGRFIRRRVCSNCVYERDSQYSQIRISEQSDGSRNLSLDALLHAYYVPGNIADLRYGYEQTYAVATERFAGQVPPRCLFIGGGGFIFPRFVKHRWPAASVEVAEIDPAVTDAATQAFGLQSSEFRVIRGNGIRSASNPVTVPASEDVLPIEIYHLDARNHVEDLLARKRSGGPFEPFDFIYGDAFNHFSVPFQLVTLEFFSRLRELLRPDTGLYLMNVVDTYQSGLFLGAVYNTMRRVFPAVYILARRRLSERPEDRDTFVVVGALRPLDTLLLRPREGEQMRAGLPPDAEELRVLEIRSRGIVLTDDYSPVENLLASVD